MPGIERAERDTTLLVILWV